MTTKLNGAFKLSKASKIQIASAGKNSAVARKLWVEAEASAQYRPKSRTTTDTPTSD